MSHSAISMAESAYTTGPIRPWIWKNLGVAAKPVHKPGMWGTYMDAVYPGKAIIEGGQTSTGSVKPLKGFPGFGAKSTPAESSEKGSFCRTGI
jgi:hypothetical protein